MPGFKPGGSGGLSNPVTNLEFSGAGPHLTAPSGQSLVYKGNLAAGASNSDHVFDTTNTRTAGKLLQVLNNGVQKFAVQPDGTIIGASSTLLGNGTGGYWSSNGGFIANGGSNGFRLSGGGLWVVSGGYSLLSADGTSNLRLHAGGTKSILIDGANQIADTDLTTSHWSAFIDEAANTLTFRVKYSTGVIKTGTVLLT